MAANNANQNNNNNNKNDDDDLYGDLDLTLEKPRAVLPASETSGPRTGAEERKRKIPPVALSSGRVSNANANANANTNAKPVPVVAVDVARLRAENESMRERIRVLEEENARLKRNIGTLFRTAKNEIQRKDDQIERFQRQREEQQR